MRKIGLIIATLEEIQAFHNKYKNSFTEIETKPFTIYHSILDNLELYILNSGVGTIKASIATTILINNYHCDLILNYGVVGSLTNNLNVSDIVFVDKIVHYDFDTSSVDHVKKGQYEEYDSPLIEVNQKYLNILKNLFPKINVVSLASGDKFLSDNQIKQSLYHEFNTSICDMESAGIILTSNIFNVPSLFIKSISDSSNGQSNIEYENNASNVALSSIDILFKIIDTLNKGYYFIYQDNKIILLDLDNNQIGYIGYNIINPTVLDVVTTKVDSKYQGKGYAKILIQEYVNYLIKNNLKTDLTCSYAINYFLKNNELNKLINKVNNPSCSL